MLMSDERSPAKSVPLLIALLIFAQLDLASAFAWPQSLLALLHLTPAPDDLARGVCAGIGSSIDFMAIFMLLRVVVLRTFGPARQRPN